MSACACILLQIETLQLKKIVSYTQLTLLFNEIDHIAIVYVRSTLFCSHRINLLSLPFFSLSLPRQYKKKKKGWRVYVCKCACGRLIIMTILLFVSSSMSGWLASLLNRLRVCMCIYIKKRKDHDVITNRLCTWPDVVHRHMLDYNSRRYLFLTVSFIFLSIRNRKNFYDITVCLY
jgi:hypothetical protein